MLVPTAGISGVGLLDFPVPADQLLAKLAKFLEVSGAEAHLTIPQELGHFLDGTLPPSGTLPPLDELTGRPLCIVVPLVGMHQALLLDLTLEFADQLLAKEELNGRPPSMLVPTAGISGVRSLLDFPVPADQLLAKLAKFLEVSG